MRVALVYDRVNKWGGAESVLLALHQIWPDAPLYTSVYDPIKAAWAAVFEIRTSFLQNTPLPKDRHEYYPFLMGLAFETFTFDKFDLVISVTHEFAKAIITKPQTLHICYCLTPTGYLWSGYDSYFSSLASWKKAVVNPLIHYLRWYDQIICHRPDFYLAISQTVADRIKKYYGHDSPVIYPPVSIPEKPGGGMSGDYYLIVSRLVPNKNLEIAVRAFNKLSCKLKIIGTGRDEKRLKSLAKSNVEFLGYLTDEEVAKYYKNSIAVVVPGVEDFGIVSVESQGYGKPVVAFRQGGSTETVIEGKTGYFFDQHTAQSLMKVLKTAKFDKIKPIDCKTNANKFAKQKFVSKFSNFVESCLGSRHNFL